MKKLLILIPMLFLACKTVSVQSETPRVTTTPGLVHLEKDPNSNISFYVLDHLIVGIQNKEVILAEIRGVGNNSGAVFAFHLAASKPLIYGCKMASIRANETVLTADGASYELSKHEDLFVEEVLFQFRRSNLESISNASVFQVSFCGVEFNPNDTQMAQIRQFVQSVLSYKPTDELSL